MPSILTPPYALDSCSKAYYCSPTPKAKILCPFPSSIVKCSNQGLAKNMFRVLEALTIPSYVSPFHALGLDDLVVHSFSLPSSPLQLKAGYPWHFPLAYVSYSWWNPNPHYLTCSSHVYFGLTETGRIVTIDIFH
jgi:hypothetical protein